MLAFSLSNLPLLGRIPQESSAIRIDLAVPFLHGRLFRATNF
jgi:cytochrome b subunit of formate dehydrogenase